MIEKRGPIGSVELLRQMVGRKVIGVQRQIFESDLKLEDFQQSADGSIELNWTWRIFL